MVFEKFRKSDDRDLYDADDVVRRINDKMKLEWEEKWKRRVDSDKELRAELEEKWKADIAEEMTRWMEKNHIRDQEYITYLTRLCDAFSRLGTELSWEDAIWLWGKLKDLRITATIFKLKSGLYTVLIGENRAPSNAIGIMVETQTGWEMEPL